MKDVNSPVKRLTRAEQQSRTRLALLDAAMALFVERGVAATTIEEVTARAGFTRGAFYSNFDSKDDLFISTCERFLELLHTAARPTGEVPRDAGQAFVERMARAGSAIDGSASMFLSEMLLYTLRNPRLIDASAELHQRQLAPAVDFVRITLANAGITDPGVPLDVLANLAQGLTLILDLLGRVDPTLDAKAVLATGMSLIMRGLASP